MKEYCRGAWASQAQGLETEGFLRTSGPGSFSAQGRGGGPADSVFGS